MAEHAVVIRAAKAILPQGPSLVDVAIGDAGTIAAIALPGTLDGRSFIDGDGLVAVPGGVDLHVHIDTFFGGATTRDDFFAGTAAALFGGTTTIAQFALPRPGETSLAAVERTKSEAGPQAVADYAIHGAMVAETYAASLAQLDDLADAGVGTVKIFSAYTDVLGLSLGRIQRLLRLAAERDITVFVHAETDSLIVESVADVVAAGHLDARGHALSRPPQAETDAIRSIADLAIDAGARIYIVHVSAASSVATIRDRRRAGARLLAETCPHYLMLDESVYDQADGGRWICSPPIRSGEHRAALWAGLLDGTLNAVSSDHNCFDRAQKGSPETDFREVPNGLPGIESRLPIMIGAAIEGRLDWRRLAEVTAETPARILGLSPRKGSIAVGSDADIVLVDPAGETVLGPGHMATDFSPYDGTPVRGRIQSVFRRGVRVIEDGVLRAEPGSGAWLAVGAATRSVAGA
jgi:dihydropyrimidinase